MTDNEFTTALSNVLTNVPGWKGNKSTSESQLTSFANLKKGTEGVFDNSGDSSELKTPGYPEEEEDMDEDEMSQLPIMGDDPRFPIEEII